MIDDKKEFNGKIVLNLVLEGALVGVLAGLVVILYRILIDNSLKFITNYYNNANIKMILPLLLIFLFLSYLARYFIKWAPLSGGSGIPQVMGEIQGRFNMNPIKVMISKFVGGTAGALGGLSLGKEGPSVQIGGACGKLIARLTKREDLTKSLISAGAGAGLAGAFCAPLSGVLITMEEFTKTFSPYVFIPTISACLVTTIITKVIFGLELTFSFTIVEQLPLQVYFHIIALGIFVSIVGVVFNRGLIFAKDKLNKLNISPLILTYMAFLLAIIIGLTYPEVLGGGHKLVELVNSTSGSIKLLTTVLLLKLFFTAICFGTGIQGGTLVPTLSMGALAGAIYFYATKKLGLSSLNDEFLTNFIVLGMAGMLASVMRSSLTSIMIVLEMTGSYVHFAGFALVVIISYLFAYLLNSKPLYEALLDNMIVDMRKVEKEDIV
ncbi:MAG: ClC family H(+)/Cl(-) exchange transporter [Peptoniphilaceae bacterium]|nr:ClC family H(+)/Cl(-) exchange transporter [Peptoniphilaceae bacterium]MDY6018477.1 ClC family H(+)/Cl(-) exchange transporter [Anaerococcus sp.]